MMKLSLLICILVSCTVLAHADVVSVPIRTFAGQTSYVRSVAFSPDGASVLVGGDAEEGGKAVLC